ncbi:MAG: hypothetical protein DRI44_02130 [Chlamydiae bacterium]|nr:MAG: hypothetical protein DRI44_02130 [Chlamydiota bacterium]
MNSYKKIQSVICVLLCVSILVATSGCSAFRSSRQSINIACYPEGSSVTVNGNHYKTPATVSVRRNESVSIQCYKKGYQPYNRVIGTHLNTTGILDIVGTCIFILPCIGLFTPGAFSLDETNVLATLYEK